MNVCLVTFVNEKKGFYHIWRTTQPNHEKNVTVVNLFSKAKASLTGKLSATPAATTTLFRVILNTEKEDWAVTERSDIDVISLREEVSKKRTELENLGLTRISRRDTVAIPSGKYAGKAYKYRLLANMTYVQIKKLVNDMLVDCQMADADKREKFARRIAKGANRLDSEIDNISQMWCHIYENFSENV